MTRSTWGYDVSLSSEGSVELRVTNAECDLLTCYKLSEALTKKSNASSWWTGHLGFHEVVKVVKTNPIEDLMKEATVVKDKDSST